VAESLSGPTGIAFDSQRRLWVANSGNGTVVRFDVPQIASGGPRGARQIIRGFRRPVSIAFDAAGSLWVSDIGANTITSYSADELTRESPAPTVVLHAAAGSLALPAGIAFDANGNLWVANIGNHTIASFAAAQLTASGSPAPHVVLSPNAGSLSIPTGLAFDAGRNLWVLNDDGTLQKFASASLSATGSPDPAVRITLNGYSSFWSMAFWPKPAGLPLN
jgi:sugar lactone lactonase YvrE